MKTKIITFTLALCVLLCIASSAVSADTGYTISADIEYCTYMEDNVHVSISIENVYENCTAVVGVYNPNGNLIVASTLEITNGTKGNVETSIPCKKLEKNSTVKVFFIAGYGTFAPVGEVLTETIFIEDISNAIFVVKVGLDTNEEGDEVVYVEGFKDSESVTYILEDSNLAEETAKIGNLVIPTYNFDSTVKALNVVSNGTIHDGNPDYVNSAYRGISGEITYINGRNIYLDGTMGTESGTCYNIKSANVYVYDATSNAKVKYNVGESVGYFDYDEELGLYTNSDDTDNKVTAYAYEVDGNIADLVYYIHN